MTQKEQQYIALYRRWRPQTFGEAVGQEHVTRTLQNALRMGRVAHAYLFCGLRGTGKTSMAKLLAKSINCLEPAPEGYAFPVEPCNKCLSCQDINRGRSMDVLEIDAASNRGIDEIRDLREKVRFAPAQSRYKVYIIDEVHMLTNEAFNALLKTLEEPPGKVIFILATTEASRLPATVISRCQRFDFRLLEAKEISDRLQEVAGRMGFSIGKDGLSLLANMAEGSLRDALGLLEQCASYADGAIEAEQIQSIFGIAAPVNLYQLMEAVHKEDLAQGFTIIKDIVYSGKEPGQFLKDLSSYVRLLLLQEGGVAQDLIEQEAPFLAPFIGKQKGIFLKESLLEMLEITSDVDRQLRSVTRPQFLLELCFLRLVRAHRFGPYLASGELFKKLEELETKGFIKGEHTKGGHTTAAPALTASASSDLTSRPQQEVGKKAAPAGSSLAEEKLKDTWEEKILPDLKRKHITVYAWLEGSRPQSLEGGVLNIVFDPSHEFHREQTERPEHKEIIEKVAAYHLQQKIKVKTSLSGSEKEEQAEQKWETAAKEKKRKAARSAGIVSGDENPFIREVQKMFKGRVFEGKWSDITEGKGIIK